jgi:hypothetical protein
MAWRPYENLIDGELDNRTPEQVTGWMRFYRRGKRPLRVTFDLAGDFHDDIRGKVIRLSNPHVSERNAELDRRGTYMEGFSSVQQGSVGDITAGIPLGPWTDEIARTLMAQNERAWDDAGIRGAEREERRKEWSGRYRAHIDAGDLFYPYVDYPYIEWYSDANGRVVLELDPSQVEVVDGGSTPGKKSPEKLRSDDRKREAAMASHMASLVDALSRENRKNGGDGDVSGAVIG